MEAHGDGEPRAYSHPLRGTRHEPSDRNFSHMGQGKEIELKQDKASRAYHRGQKQNTNISLMIFKDVTQL